MEWEVNKGNPDSERRQLNRILDEINQTIVAIPGGVVDTVVAGSGIAVDSTDAANPIVALSPATISTLGTALQPGDNVSELVNDAGYSTTTGTVTSVDLGASTGLTPSGGPITGAGTLTYALSANLQAWHGIAPADKLDTTSYTAADVLAKILTVDGAGSGLDADLLDGQSSAYYHNAANLTGTIADARLSSNVPLKDAANTWSTTQTLSVAPIFTDAAGTRTALGLGTAATQNTGTSGATVPLLNGNNTHSGLITFSQEITVNDTGSIFQLSGSTLPAAASSTIATFARSPNTGAQAAISIISGNTSSLCAINFGDTDLENPGRFSYDHSTETFSWRVNATNNILQLSSTALTASTSRYDTGIESPASWAANVNDLALGSSTRILRVSGTAARDFTGMVPAGGGRRILVCNVGSFDIVIKHQNAGSTAANRFICPGNVDFTLNQSDSVEVWYDTTSSRWRVIGF